MFAFDAPGDANDTRMKHIVRHTDTRYPKIIYVSFLFSVPIPLPDTPHDEYLILVQNEPPLVALSLPNAASESLEKKKFLSICLAHCLAHPGPEHLAPLNKTKDFSFLSCAHPGSEHLAPPQLFPI